MQPTRPAQRSATTAFAPSKSARPLRSSMRPVGDTTSILSLAQGLDSLGARATVQAGRSATRPRLSALRAELSPRAADRRAMERNARRAGPMVRRQRARVGAIHHRRSATRRRIRSGERHRRPRCGRTRRSGANRFAAAAQSAGADVCVRRLRSGAFEQRRRSVGLGVIGRRRRADELRQPLGISRGRDADRRARLESARASKARACSFR